MKIFQQLAVLMLIAGGFVESMYTMYATPAGAASSNPAFYNWLECKSGNAVYKK